MKKIVLTAVVLLVAVAAVSLALFLPKAANSAEESSSLNSSVLPVSSEFVATKTLEEVVTAADTVITGSIIKADVKASGVLYTMNVVKVYKGRNYTSMGYAYVNGKQTLQIGSTYLFVGKTGSEKYHYYEPFENAPWVFSVQEDGTLTPASNGNSALISDVYGATLPLISSYCDII